MLKFFKLNQIAILLTSYLVMLFAFVPGVYAVEDIGTGGTGSGGNETFTGGGGGIFGVINPPKGVTSGVSGLGNLVGAMLRILVVVAGVWALFNFIMAGYQFMQAGGDSKAVSAAWAKIWQSLLGIVIVAASFLFAAIIGQIFFGKWDAILVPTLVAP